MKDYAKFMKWAVVYITDRKGQDDRKSKVKVEALFSSPVQAEDNYIIRNQEIKRYILHVDDLEEFETVYNQLQDLRENMENMQSSTLKILILVAIRKTNGARY